MKRQLSLASLLLIAACTGGQGEPASGCSGQCATAASHLSAADVEAILSKGIQEAAARGTPATLAVVDRAGNVLAVFRMNGSASAIRVDSGRGVAGGLEGIDILPDALVAIAKAVTAAYLSSEGSALTTRTASQIVQEFFNPGERDQPGGPLFGVQFSQLPCSDLNLAFAGGVAGAGPQRSPLGLAADSGGLPLYKEGALVGGVGVISDGVYGLDLDVMDEDLDSDELIAVAAAIDFAPPPDRLASVITVDGKTLRYVDARPASLRSNPAVVPPFTAFDGPAGQLLAVRGYSDAQIRAGTAFGQPASGIRAAGADFAGLDAFVLVDRSGQERFAPISATDGAETGGLALTAGEVTRLLRSALAVAARARSQIRRPLGLAARVSVSVVDSYGTILGIARSRDAPVFGIDVSLQKARTAAFFSNPAAAADLLAVPDTRHAGNGARVSIAGYVGAFRDFVGNPTALADGAIAYGSRSIGNLARPYFPDGLRDSHHGPLSRAIQDWSPFSVGLQLDLVNSALLQHVGSVVQGTPDVGAGACAETPLTPAGTRRLANGMQIFAGGVPIYRAGRLVGGIGVSGDGVDQDDMIAFLGVHETGLSAPGGLGNAPPASRADQIEVRGVRLRYVQCPQAPYLAGAEQNVCAGK